MTLNFHKIRNLYLRRIVMLVVGVQGLLVVNPALLVYRSLRDVLNCVVYTIRERNPIRWFWTDLGFDLRITWESFKRAQGSIIGRTIFHWFF